MICHETICFFNVTFLLGALCWQVAVIFLSNVKWHVHVHAHYSFDFYRGSNHWFFFNHHCLSWFPFLCGGLRLENKMHYKKNTMAPIIIAIQWVCLLRGKIKYLSIWIEYTWFCILNTASFINVCFNVLPLHKLSAYKTSVDFRTSLCVCFWITSSFEVNSRGGRIDPNSFDTNAGIGIRSILCFYPLKFNFIHSLKHI